MLCPLQSVFVFFFLARSLSFSDCVFRSFVLTFEAKKLPYNEQRHIHTSHRTSWKTMRTSEWWIARKKENIHRRERRNDKWWSGEEMLLAEKHGYPTSNNNSNINANDGRARKTNKKSTKNIFGWIQPLQSYTYKPAEKKRKDFSHFTLTWSWM